jgi:uncharacterized membrane protein (GlpM family)
MTSHSILVAIFQAMLCFGIVALIRIAVVYLGSRLGGILIGTPMLVFPLLAMQAWLGPPVTQDETNGSIGSIAAIAAALWSMWLPINYTPRSATFVTALSWLLAITIIYMTGVPAVVMALAIAVNAILILVRNRDHRPAAGPRRTNLTEAAFPTAVFLVVFFTTKELVPDFVRGVLAMFPVVMLATIYFVRSAATNEGFHSFIVYSHCAITATAMFVIGVHFSLASFPIAVSLAIGLVVSIATSLTISLVWRPSSGTITKRGGSSAEAS